MSLIRHHILVFKLNMEIKNVERSEKLDGPLTRNSPLKGCRVSRLDSDSEPLTYVLMLSLHSSWRIMDFSLCLPEQLFTSCPPAGPHASCDRQQAIGWTHLG